MSTDPPRPAPAADGSSAGEMLLNQYSSLRDEVLFLMQANESRTFTAFGVASTTWAVLLALLGDGRQVPGATFLLPLPILVLAYNTHVVNGRRVANIGSFLSASSRFHYGAVGDWETEVSLFARTTTAPMSSRVPLRLTYWLISAAATVVAVVIALVTDRPGNLRAADLVAIGLVAIAVGLGLRRIQQADQSFAASRATFDDYWNGRFGLGDPPTA